MFSSTLENGTRVNLCERREEPETVFPFRKNCIVSEERAKKEKYFEILTEASTPQNKELICVGMNAGWSRCVL